MGEVGAEEQAGLAPPFESVRKVLVLLAQELARRARVSTRAQEAVREGVEVEPLAGQSEVREEEATRVVVVLDGDLVLRVRSGERCVGDLLAADPGRQERGELGLQIESPEPRIGAGERLPPSARPVQAPGVVAELSNLLELVVESLERLGRAVPGTLRQERVDGAAERLGALEEPFLSPPGGPTNSNHRAPERFTLLQGCRGAA
jgi:hypothetical protein